MNWQVQKTRKSNQKKRRWRLNSIPMFTALVVWLCILPLLALVAVPLLGWQVAGYLAADFLITDIALCWVLCSFNTPKTHEICDK